MLAFSLKRPSFSENVCLFFVVFEKKGKNIQKTRNSAKSLEIIVRTLLALYYDENCNFRCKLHVPQEIG